MLQAQSLVQKRDTQSRQWSAKNYGTLGAAAHLGDQKGPALASPPPTWVTTLSNLTMDDLLRAFVLPMASRCATGY